MNAPNGTLAAIDRAIARNLERGAAKGSPSDMDLRNVRDVVTELYEALAYAIDNPEFDSAEFDRRARAALAEAAP